MGSRITQEAVAIVADVATDTTGGSARITQETRVILIDPTAFTKGGLARVTQVARVTIATIQIAGGGLPTVGMGS